jgi:HK97 family phage portal protein
MNVLKRAWNWATTYDDNKRATTYPTIDEVCYGEAENPNAPITADKALTYVAYWAAIQRISSDTAKLPIHEYEKGNKLTSNNGVAALLSTKPNPTQTPYTFKQTMQSHALSWGNAYAEIIRNGGGKPVSLSIIHPSRVTVVPSADGMSISYQIWQPTGSTSVIAGTNMLHVHGLGDGIIGYSPVYLFRQNLKLSLEAEKTGAKFFQNMMRPSAVMSHPKTLGEEAYNRLKKSINQRNQGSSNAGDVMLLEEGLTMAQWSIPPSDAQFLETRVMGIQDVSRIFNIPPHKLADLSRSTFSNIEEQQVEYVVDCLQPWLTNWEQEIEAKLLTESERERISVRFAVEGLLRGNSTARSDFYTKMFNLGVYSVNDIRALENMESISGGDEHFVQVNLQTLENAAIAKAEVQPSPVAPPVQPEEPQDNEDLDDV